MKLADVAEARLGKMLDAQKNRGRPHPYLANPNVRWFDVDLSNLKRMLFEEDEEEKFSIRDGDVLICEGGEAGRAAIWKGPDKGIKFQKAIHRVRPGAQLLNRFLVHRLFYDYHSGGLNDYYTGATINHLTGQDLARYEFPLPPLDEQRRIAAILDQADDLRRKRREALERIEGLISVIFVAMFGNPKIELNRWSKIVFDQACRDETSESAKLQRGDYQLNGEYPVIDQGQSDVAGWTDDPELLCTSKLPVIIFGDHTRSVKYVDHPFVIGADGAKVLKPRASFHPLFFAHLLRRLPIPDLGYSRHMREVKRLLFPCPPLELQSLFATRVAEIDKLKVRHYAHLAKLEALFASLQHRAFRGEL